MSRSWPEKADPTALAEAPLRFVREYEKWAREPPWKLLDQVREAALCAKRSWPNYAYADLATYRYAFDKLNGDFENDYSGFIAFTALAAWRLTRGIYRFDSHLAAALADTDPATTIPSDLLTRLPEWGTCIDGAALAADGRVLFALATISYHPGSDDVFYLVLVFRSWVFRTLKFALSEKASIDEMLAQDQKAQRAAGKPYAKIEREDKALMSAAIAHFLYLCSAEPDMPAPPPPPQLVKTKGGRRIFPPESRVVEVGARFGAIFKRTRDDFIDAETRAKTGRAMPPHWRRAHWSTYWIGPKSSSSRQRVLRWLAPTFVNAIDGESQVVVRGVQAEV